MFYLTTNENAPQYKVVTIDISDPHFKRKELIPEDKSAKLETVDFVNEDYFALVYKRNVRLFFNIRIGGSNLPDMSSCCP